MIFKLLYKSNCSVLVYGIFNQWFTISVVVVVLVAQLCPTLCDPMDCGPPCSSVHGTLQEKILEWISIPFSQPRAQTQVSCTAGRFFTIWATGKILKHRTIPRFLTFLQWHSSIYISTSFCYSISVPTFRKKVHLCK